MFDVSVIIPSYNRGHLVGQTLESVLGQTRLPAEVIVVDDGSTDNTAEVVARFPAVRYQRIDNSGVCRARNVGVQMARSSWLAFCDSDDLWEKDKLETQFRLLARNPQTEYCFTNFVTFSAAGTAKRSKFDDGPAGYWDDLPVLHADNDGFVVAGSLYAHILRFQPIFPSTLLMTRAFFERVGPFQEAFGRLPSEDREFTLRCVQEPPLAVVARPVVRIRKHAENISASLLRNRMGDIEILEYARQRHRTGREQPRLLEEHILRNRIAALELAFARAEMDLVRDLGHRIPRQRRSAKLWIKYGTSVLPWPVATRICHGLQRLRELCGPATKEECR